LKQLLIIFFFLLINLYVLGSNNKDITLYVLGEYPNWKWIKSIDEKNLSKYQGEIKNGKPNGLGILTSTNGWKYYGSWKNGKILNGSEYDNFGNIIFKWVEGKRKYHNFNVKFR
tara:strand:- start:54 stop:395 length:342 start_codon:yes stop_codon:yes gene_type:complete